MQDLTNPDSKKREKLAAFSLILYKTATQKHLTEKSQAYV